MYIRRTIFDDTMGHTFSSLQEMCDFHGVKKSVYQDRKSRGLSEKECLDPNRRPCKGKSQAFTDHTGYTFPSFKAFCEHYGLKECTARGRLKRGCTIEEIMSESKLTTNTEVYDHLGQKYPSVKDMLKHYNLTDVIYYQRIKKGMSLKDVLTTPIRKHKSVPETKDDCTDHKGKRFSSVKDMCGAYGIDKSTYQRRLERKWSKEQALTTPIDTTVHGRQVTDPLGNTYPMLKDMLKAHNTNITTYLERTRKGYSMAEALGLLPLINHEAKNIVINENLIMVKPIDNCNRNKPGLPEYFLCVYNKHDIILRHDDIVAQYKPMH